MNVITSKQPNEIVLMLDENLSGRTILAGLQEKRIPVKSQADYNIKRGVSDEELLERLSKHKNVYLVSKDRDFRYKPSVKKALDEAKIGSFVITSSKNKTGSQLVELIEGYWPKIQKFIQQHPRPFVAVIKGDGTIGIHEKKQKADQRFMTQ